MPYSFPVYNWTADGNGLFHSSITSGIVTLTGSISISGSVTQGQVLTSSNTLSRSPATLGTVTVAWYWDDATLIAGATSLTYTSQVTDVGYGLYSVHSGTDSMGNAWSSQSATTSAITSAGVVTLADVDFTEAEFVVGSEVLSERTPASTYANTSWATYNAGTTTLTVENDVDFTSGRCIESIIQATPEPAGGVYSALEFDVSNINLDDVYIQFEAKKSSKGSVKFMKIKGINNENGDGQQDYADFTVQPTWDVLAGTIPDNLTECGFGTGVNYTTGLPDYENDSNAVARFNGTNPEFLGINNYPLTQNTPNGIFNYFGSNFAFVYGQVHTFKFRFKYSSGTSLANEVADGAIYVEIDGVVYLDVQNIFNRHFTNGSMDKIAFFDWGQNNNAIHTLRYSGFKISTGGFA